jgi:hypothetical protein
LRNPAVANKHAVWSVPLAAHCTVGAAAAVAGNLTVSELDYHPAAPTFVPIHMMPPDLLIDIAVNAEVNPRLDARPTA